MLDEYTPQVDADESGGRYITWNTHEGDWKTKGIGSQRT